LRAACEHWRSPTNSRMVRYGSALQRSIRMTDTADLAVKPALSAKDEVRALLDRLPDTVTLEDIQYHLDVYIKVLQTEASDPRDDMPHEEVFQEFEDKGRREGWCGGPRRVPSCARSRPTLVPGRRRALAVSWSASVRPQASA